MLKVYFVTEGPVCILTDTYQEVWKVQAKVSNDDVTVHDMVFTFRTEEHALKFKRDVNYSMEPIDIGKEE